MLNVIPTSGLRAYIIDLAPTHNVVYVQTDSDVLAEKLSELSDKGVQTDDIERLLFALCRAGVISVRDMIALQLNYLRETRPPSSGADCGSGYQCVPIDSQTDEQRAASQRLHEKRFGDSK